MWSRYLKSVCIFWQPSNVLLNSACLVKLADFGLARSLLPENAQPDHPNRLTEYVATRWYRAPEILLSSNKLRGIYIPSRESLLIFHACLLLVGRYGYGVDMWSVGCVLGELMKGKPLFSGSSTINQLQLICEITGPPSETDIESMQSPYAAKILGQLPNVEKR